jgi:hypothetical protein
VAARRQAAPGGGTSLPARNPRRWLRQAVSKAPPPGAPLCRRWTGPTSTVQMLPPGKIPGPASPVNLPPAQKQPHPGIPSPFPLTSATSAGGCLWVESHSDVFATWRWACEAVKTANCLRTHLPAVFAVQRSHALTPCQTRQRVRPTGTPRHGSSEKKNTPVTAHRQQGWSCLFYVPPTGNRIRSCPMGIKVTTGAGPIPPGAAGWPGPAWPCLPAAGSGPWSAPPSQRQSRHL